MKGSIELLTAKCLCSLYFDLAVWAMWGAPSAYLAHHRSAQPVAARTPSHYQSLQVIFFIRRGLSDPQTGRTRRRA